MKVELELTKKEWSLLWFALGMSVGRVKTDYPADSPLAQQLMDLSNKIHTQYLEQEEEQ